MANLRVAPAACSGPGVLFSVRKGRWGSLRCLAPHVYPSAAPFARLEGLGAGPRPCDPGIPPAGQRVGADREAASLVSHRRGNDLAEGRSGPSSIRDALLTNEQGAFLARD